MMRRLGNLRKSNDGFTLIEMTVVLVMIGCLLVLLLPTVIERRPALYTLEQDIGILEQDIQTLRLIQYSKTSDQNQMQLRWKNDGKGYLVMANDLLLWQRTFQPGHSCVVPSNGRIIYFKSYHSTYASTWVCQSTTQAFEIKFLLGNYQMLIQKLR